MKRLWTPARWSVFIGKKIEKAFDSACINMNRGYRICPTEVVVCPTGKLLSFPLSNQKRMVAELARLPRVNPNGPIYCPGTPIKSKAKPVAMMVPMNIACPVRTVSGFFNQAANPSL